MTRHFRPLLIALALTLPCAPALHAETETEAESSPSAFSLRGFGTVGMSRSSSPHAEFVRDLSQPSGIKGGTWSGKIDTVLGLQANWQIIPEIELVGQAVSRLRYDGSRDPEIMMAFAKWDPSPNTSLRAGRIGADFMMLADSRLVGYSYLPVRPSVDFFGPLFFSHFDGVDAAWTAPLSHGLFRAKLFGGETHEKTSGTPGIWDTSSSPVWGIVLDYTTGPWQLRFNTAQIQFSRDINFGPLPDALRAAGSALNVPSAIAAANALTTQGKTATFYSLGFVYDQGPLLVQGMANQIHQESGVFADSQAEYVFAAYRLGLVSPYAGISQWKSQNKSLVTGLPNPAFAALNTGFDTIMAAAAVNQQTYTVGGRWDFYQNMALKGQFDAIRGQSGSRFPYARSDPNWNGKTNVLSVVVDFIF